MSGDAARLADGSLPVACPVCGQGNLAGELFCSRCTSPLLVAALGELAEEERRICLAHLLGVLAAAVGEATDAGGEEDHDDELWRAYLSAFWLRPETALILYGEALAVRQLASDARGPWLDLGCGDGIHAALCGGWRFEAGFDAFQCSDLSARDIYNHWDAGGFRAPVARAGRLVEWGVDIKATAVARAGALGVFGRVERADAACLPVPSGGVGVIFSNMLRDLGEPLDGALDECRRVLRDDGVLLISTMTPAYARHLCFAPAARAAAEGGDEEKARELLRLDRGRSVFCRRQLDAGQWQDILGRHGLRIEAVRPVAGPQLIRFWDVGLRPFSMALLRERERWAAAGTLGVIKAAAVKLLATVLEPLRRRMRGGEACMNMLAIRKA